MPAGIFLVPNDLMVLAGYTSIPGAWGAYNRIRTAIGKTTGKRITIEEYAAYEMIPVEQVYAALQPKQIKKQCTQLKIEM